MLQFIACTSRNNQGRRSERQNFFIYINVLYFEKIIIFLYSFSKYGAFGYSEILICFNSDINLRFLERKSNGDLIEHRYITTILVSNDLQHANVQKSEWSRTPDWRLSFFESSSPTRQRHYSGRLSSRKGGTSKVVGPRWRSVSAPWRLPWLLKL